MGQAGAVPVGLVVKEGVFVLFHDVERPVVDNRSSDGRLGDGQLFPLEPSHKDRIQAVADVCAAPHLGKGQHARIGRTGEI